MKSKQGMIIDCHSHHQPASDTVAVQNIRVTNDCFHFSFTPGHYYSVGIHPWDLIHFGDNWHQAMLTMARHSQVVAIGECGLDSTVKVSLATQKQIWAWHIAASEATRKPLIIHCVGYFHELLAIKKSTKPQQAWIVHGFRGKPALATQLVQAGCYLSFGVSYPRESVAVTPAHKILVESDTNYVDVKQLFLEIAEIKNINPDALSAASTLFQIRNILPKKS